jgi:hypothetical protein
MANQLTANASLSAIVDQFTLAGSAAINTSTTGSNGIGLSINVTNAWTAVDISELSDFRYGWFYNDTTGSAIITVATGSTGQNVLCKLQPGDASLVSWSGSLASIYVKSLPEDSTLQCVLVES